MTDQAYNLRKKAWEKKRRASYISVSSGKGGVGKTNFVVNLAYWLAKMGKKVLVFDADLGLANIDILLNLTVKSSIRKYLRGEAEMEDLLKKDVYGFDVVPAASGFAELTKLDDEEFEKLVEIFVSMDTMYDYILFDTGAGISDTVTRFAAIADNVIVMTQPEPTAITDAYAFMKVVHFEHGVDKVQFVLNRVEDVPGVKSIYMSMKNVAMKFLNIDLELLGHLREDKQLISAVRQQKPVSEVSPNGSYSRDIYNIARKIVGLPKEKEKPGLYGILKGVFK
ncbi:MinD/ParA family protein [Limisalsivibrio acetivorans]|uniref:MinD/ParA family protein n=1 Tax=Limisalsivibrio acetivorans TaxID=1304888 RepID=UPI0003B708F6|nr:MinD/ParA family protein [Limisalsivibrio acetivorans]